MNLWRPIFMRRLAWRLALRGWFRAGYGRYFGWPRWWPTAIVRYSPHTAEWKVFGISNEMPLGDALDHAEDTFGCPDIKRPGDMRREKP